MEAITIRGNTKGSVLLSIILSAIVIGFSICGLRIFETEPVPAGVRILITILIAAGLFMPGIVYLTDNILAYLKKVSINEDRITFQYPLQKKKQVCVEDLTFWGCVAYVPRSTKIFFCTVDKGTIMDYLNTHWSACQRIYGKNKTEQFKCSDEGMLQLAVGTYLHRCFFFPRPGVFMLDYGSTNRLKFLVDALKADAFLAGPWLLTTKQAWEEYARLDTGNGTGGQGDGFA